MIGVYLPLRLNFFTLVDKSTYIKLQKIKYRLSLNQNHSSNYNRVYIHINKKNQLFHRWILGLEKTIKVVDHVDNDPLNNTLENLRLCTLGENGANRKTFNGKLGLKCIFKLSSKDGYYYEIQKNGGKHRGPIFSSLKICYLEYLKVSKDTHRDFHKARELGKYELEIFTPRRASKNKKYNKDNIQYVGVFTCRGSSKYRVQFKIYNKLFSENGFTCLIEAAKFYDKLVYNHHGILKGKFNFPENYTVFL